MDAINHLLLHKGRMPIGRDILDDIAHNVASLEAQLCSENPLTIPHVEGNYHVSAMTIALKQLADLYSSIWTPQKMLTPNDSAFLVGNGNHWQALIKESDGWYVCDKGRSQVQDLLNFLQVASRRGMVFQLHSQTPESGDMDWEADLPSRKRTMDEACIPLLPAIPLITDGTEQSIIDVDEPEGKKPRCTTPTSETQEALLQLADTYTPLPEETPDPPVTRSTTAETPDIEWKEVTVGVTPMLHSEVHGRYKCISCGYERDTSLGIATHYGRYCPKRVTKTEEIPVE